MSNIFNTKGFSHVVALEIATYNRCWKCHASPPEARQFISEDNINYNTRALQQISTLPFSLTSSENGIALCEPCYKNFHVDHDPGLIIVPVDLDYFIRYEEIDYEARAHMANEGMVRGRKCPSRMEYFDHQYNEGKIGEWDGGGLYKRPILQRFHPAIPLSFFRVSKRMAWYPDCHVASGNGISRKDRASCHPLRGKA